MLVFNRVCTYNVKGASTKSIKLNSNDTIVICNAQAYKKASSKFRDLLEYMALKDKQQQKERYKND